MIGAPFDSMQPSMLIVIELVVTRAIAGLFVGFDGLSAARTKLVPE